ncbi:MAG: hypothetical protein JKX76_00095 [Colwellia sp.]|nr:hypothetical protein [Colwellia sp.]
MQLDMFAILEPKPQPSAWVEPEIREVTINAEGKPHVFKCHEGEPDPIAMEIRGIPCIVSFGYGFATHAVQPVGSDFWSKTGYRNFSIGSGLHEHSEQIREIVETYIDAPKKDGNGCGGKLVKWWPGYVHQWQQNLAFHHGRDRSEMWQQWGPEKHAEMWANHDADQAKALCKMDAAGIDPNDVGPPSYFKGKWPTFGPDLFNG